MHSSASSCASLLLVLASCVTFACSDNGRTGGASPTGPSAFGLSSSSLSLTAEPGVIVPEFRPNSTCRRQPAFDARLNVTLRPRQDMFIRSFGFEFVDGFGGRVFPVVLPVGSSDVNNSILLPIPLPTILALPTTSPITFPGQVAMSNTQVRAGTLSTFPARLRFDCGVPDRGTLFISVETADSRGTVNTSRITAHVGQ